MTKHEQHYRGRHMITNMIMITTMFYVQLIHINNDDSNTIDDNDNSNNNDNNNTNSN